MTKRSPYTAQQRQTGADETCAAVPATRPTNRDKRSTVSRHNRAACTWNGRRCVLSLYYGGRKESSKGRSWQLAVSASLDSICRGSESTEPLLRESPAPRLENLGTAPVQENCCCCCRPFSLLLASGVLHREKKWKTRVASLSQYNVPAHLPTGRTSSECSGPADVMREKSNPHHDWSGYQTQLVRGRASKERSLTKTSCMDDV